VADGERRASNERIATIIEIVQTGEHDGSVLAEKTIARLHRKNHTAMRLAPNLTADRNGKNDAVGSSRTEIE
jgi:hypothetical protein